MPTILITGANRGLGLEFTRQYAAANWNVVACCRNPENSPELQKLAARFANLVTLHQLDVGNFDQIDQLLQTLNGQTIDILLNNAGIYPDSGRKLSNAEFEHWALAFRINTMAPFKMVQTFAPLVAKSDHRKIVNITSKMGSIDDNTSGGSYLYRSSKTALNMVTKSLAIDLAPLGITTIVLHPGWVQTDMGGPNGLINAEQSVTGMRRVIEQLTPADNGQFFAYDGQAIPW